MACDVITLRPAPAAEPCARVGDSGYAEIAFLQCRRYIAFLRLAIGLEPDGARLRIRRSDTDFDPYIDVVIEYDSKNAAASDYALRCERDAPTRWRDGIRTNGRGPQDAGGADRVKLSRAPVQRVMRVSGNGLKEEGS